MVIHRDLKPANLMIGGGPFEGGSRSVAQKTGFVKIADFGLAKGQAATSLSTICGTPQYVAPEVIAKGAKSGFHSYKLSCDVWSCGVILFVLLGGYPPFYDESEPRLFDKIRWVWRAGEGSSVLTFITPKPPQTPTNPCAHGRRGAYSFNDPVWEQISDSAKELIKRCLTLDPALRPTCEDVSRSLVCVWAGVWAPEEHWRRGPQCMLGCWDSWNLQACRPRLHPYLRGGRPVLGNHML